MLLQRLITTMCFHNFEMDEAGEQYNYINGSHIISVPFSKNIFLVLQLQ